MLSEKKNRMLARALRLAEIYGPFVRFYSEGSEGNDDDDAMKKAKEDDEKAKQQEKEKFEKDRQRADQEAANARRAREELSETQVNLETAQTENEQLKKQLAAAERKAVEAGIEDTDLDESQYDGSDLALVKSIKSLKKRDEANKLEIAELKKKAVSYEEQARIEKAAEDRNQLYEGLLTDLDEEYGADCRNEAVKKFTELANEGKVPKSNPAKATRVMERCYKEVKAAKEKAKTGKDKSSLSLDSVSGGGDVLKLSGAKIKEGSLAEVRAQYAAAAKSSKG